MCALLLLQAERPQRRYITSASFSNVPSHRLLSNEVAGGEKCNGDSALDGWPIFESKNRTGCPIFAALFAAKVGIRATREPFLLPIPQQSTGRPHHRGLPMKISSPP